MMRRPPSDLGARAARAGPIDALYAAVTESLPETSVTVFDRELRFRMAYGEALSFNGWTSEDLDGKTPADVLPPDHLALLEPLFSSALSGERSSLEVPSLDGQRTLLTNIAPVEEDGVIIGGVAISVDITDRKQSDEARTRLATIVEQSDDAIVGASVDNTIVAWNRGAERIYQYQACEAIGAPVEMLVPRDQAEGERSVWAQIRAGDSIHRETHRLRRDGTIVDLSVIGSPITDSTGAVVGASEIGRDITERKLLDAKLEHLADHDALTGLLNRRAFERELASAVALSRRYGTATGLLMVDIDNFKYINDSYGHSVGDHILRSTANLMLSRLRDTDVIARLGGDEFAVILRSVGSAESRRIAETLLRMLRNDATMVQGQQVRVTASVGIAEVAPNTNVTADELLARADLALYEAKEAGRDTVTAANFERKDNPGFQVRLNWAERIRQALEQNQFLLFRQPILNLSNGRLDGHEVLLRMISEQGAIVDAGSFLPIAEHFGQMPAIDLWVIRHVLDALQAENGHGHGLVHINLSGASMSDAEVMSALPQAIAAANLDPTRLVFEITETSAIEIIADAQTLSLELARLGCKVALDDFGSGFGSFQYLKRLHFDCLKVDRGFITHMTSNETDWLTVRAIVELARGLGKTTVAEGVEDEQTLELVRETGFDHAQGFHIGRPKNPA